MPTYEFRCPKGHDFEKFYRSIGSAPTEVHCPECGALAERQLSAGAGLVFKGSGFYITDYGKDGKKDQQKASVKSDGGSGEKSDSGATPSESGSGGGAGESKSSESKSGDSKSGDSKSSASSDTKSSSSEAKSSARGNESKSASAPPKKKDTK